MSTPLFGAGAKRTKAKTYEGALGGPRVAGEVVVGEEVKVGDAANQLPQAHRHIAVAPSKLSIWERLD
jgi:hypothetical protein